MCSGVVPQQPPIYPTPSERSSSAKEANSSGFMGKTVLPSTVSGRPALGLATRGTGQFGATFESTFRSPSGPAEQFNPKASTPMEARTTAADAGSVPSNVRPFSSTVRET